MLVGKMKCTMNETACSHAVTARFGETQNAVIVVGAGIAGLSAAASLHKVCAGWTSFPANEQLEGHGSQKKMVKLLHYLCWSSFRSLAGICARLSCAITGKHAIACLTCCCVYSTFSFEDLHLC